jgi:hypothetical protein
VSTESNASSPSRALPIVLVKRGVHAAWLGTILFVLAFFDAYVSAIISTLFKYVVGAEAAFAGAFLVLGVMGVIAAVRGNRALSVTVGTDGLAVRMGMKTTLIPLQRVVSVTGTKDELTVALTGGDARVFSSPIRLSSAQVELLARRVDEAKEERGRAAVDLGASALLSREGRSLVAWREALRRVSAPSQSYRGSALSPDDLAAVLADPGAPADQRVGAALALRFAGGEEARAHIQGVAESCALTRVRVALEAVAEEELEEEALEEALEAVAPERRATGVARS